jgi:hypothetical protein
MPLTIINAHMRRLMRDQRMGVRRRVNIVEAFAAELPRLECITSIRATIPRTLAIVDSIYMALKRLGELRYLTKCLSIMLDNTHNYLVPIEPRALRAIFANYTRDPPNFRNTGIDAIYTYRDLATMLTGPLELPDTILHVIRYALHALAWQNPRNIIRVRS